MERNQNAHMRKMIAHFFGPIDVPQPPAAPLLEEPWRSLKWEDNQSLRRTACEYMPQHPDIKHLRVLLFGPVRAGKSSFINSVSSVIRGRIGIPAAASGEMSERSYTISYQTHRFQSGRGQARSFYSVAFNDIMGLEEGNGAGVHDDDIRLALKGHVMEGYKFNAASPLSDGDLGFKAQPSVQDQVHVLVCVLSANSSEVSPSILQKMRRVREAAKHLGIPQMAVVTNIDRACPETEKNLRNVYRSKHLRQKIKDFSSAVGLTENCIFPVKNYCDEIELKSEVDTLILSALTNIINFGDDYIERLYEPHSV